MLPTSIRWRLQLWLAFLLACILSGFGLTAYHLHRNNRLHQIDEEFRTRVIVLAQEIGFGPRPVGPGVPDDFGRDRPLPELLRYEMRGPFGPFGESPERRSIRLSPKTAMLFDETGTNAFYFAIWSRSGRLLRASTNAPSDLVRPPMTSGKITQIDRMRGSLRECYLYTDIGESVLVGRSVAADLEQLSAFALWLVAAGAGVLALGLGGGWVIVGKAIRPVEDISAAASRISGGNLAERIAVAEKDSELGRLAEVLNSTFDRLEDAFAQQKQFTADASHELRTPIAVIISEAQATLARERDAAQYRETIEVCLEAAQQMRRLSQSLLELARYDAGQEYIERQSFDLGEIARISADLIQPLARDRGITVHRSLEAAEMTGDPDRIRQVITNLLGNAIHYNRDGGEIRIATRMVGEKAVLTVSDTGHGIPEADRPNVFKRFYRADKSRSRSEGRCGLGLAICKAIVDAHGGTIEVTETSPAGTTFTASFSPRPSANGTGSMTVV